MKGNSNILETMGWRLEWTMVVVSPTLLFYDIQK